ncbi:MAG: hydroxymethylglutaryl-CoA lyase [Actinobacteria bacterium]|nr:hydroxymethylglutaryl-CoA lyase [Actinomycetota bacterium]
MAERIEIIEVGPRDGLQDEERVLSPEDRADFVGQALAAGAELVEAVSFVSAKRVPQMAEPEAVIALVGAAQRDRLTALVPNRRGFERALASGLRHVRCVLAASDEMNRRNFGVPTEVTAAEVGAIAREHQGEVTVGLVIGTAFGCPFEGEVPASRVLEIAAAAVDAGVGEVVLADTTGVANPRLVEERCAALVELEAPRLGAHFHNTRNTGYANALRAVDVGVRRFDASIGGIGGCPFAPGATGNVASEDLAEMLASMGFETGVDVDRLLASSAWLRDRLGHDLPGQLLHAGRASSARPDLVKEGSR